jgi:type II secretory pathway component GspD/PulD (secretin)
MIPVLIQGQDLIQARISIIETDNSFGNSGRGAIEKIAGDEGDIIQGFSLTLPSLVNPDSAALFKLTGKFGEDIWNIVIESIVQEVDGVVIADPVIVVDNGKTGKIKAINKEPYSSVNVLPNGTSTTGINFIDIGVEIEVTPEIMDQKSTDSLIRTTIKASMSEVLSHKEGNDKDLFFPVTSNREISTEVHVSQDDYLILGGLRREKRVEIESRVPFIATFLDRSIILSPLSIFFKTKEDRTVRTTLYIVANISVVKSRSLEDFEGYNKSRKEGQDFINKDRDHWLRKYR